MSVSADLDAPRPARSEDFSDALTIAFADPASGTCATLRLGLAAGRSASGMALLFHDGRQVAVVAEGDVAVDDPSSWDAIAAAGIEVATVEPLRRWRLTFAGDDASLDLDVEAAGPIDQLAAENPVAVLGGMLGFDLPVRVRGTADIGGVRVAIDAPGQRSRSWGSPVWSRITRTRIVQAWFPGGTASLAALAPAGAEHGDEVVTASLLGPHGAQAAGEARLSTTFDADGRQQRASLELWPPDNDDGSDSGPPRRLSGEVFCGTTLDLGRLRLDSAFLRWRMDGMDGIGRYDVLRRLAER